MLELIMKILDHTKLKVGMKGKWIGENPEDYLFEENGLCEITQKNKDDNSGRLKIFKKDSEPYERYWNFDSNQRDIDWEEPYVYKHVPIKHATFYRSVGD